MKFDDVPRLPKLPFILGDLALLLLAWFIADRHSKPFSPLPLFMITGCVVAGCVSFIIPFVVNYVRDREEAAISLHRELSEQFKRLIAASEHLQNATIQLKTAEEIATKNLQAAEKLPYRLQEKIAEFTQQLAEAESEEKAAIEQELTLLRSSKSEHLATMADRIVKAASEYTKLEAEARRQLAASAQLEPKLASVLTAIDARVAALTTAVQMADRLFSAPPFPKKARPASAAVDSNPPALAADAAPVSSVEPAGPSLATAPTADDSVAPPPSPRKPRAPRKPRSEEAAASESPAEASAPAPSAEASSAPGGRAAGELIAEPVVDEPPAPEDFSQVPPEEAKPAAVPSGDGLTRLTVVSYIGIGNKLYLRGEGPGLSWDKGVPLQFVSIGRWRWETDAATGPVTCKIYKNDKLEAPIGTLALPPGTEQEVNATF